MRRLRDTRGQAMVEYLMVSGLILAVSVTMLKKMLPAARKDIFKSAIECAISDVCKGTETVEDPLGDSAAGPPGGGEGGGMAGGAGHAGGGADFLPGAGDGGGSLDSPAPPGSGNSILPGGSTGDAGGPPGSGPGLFGPAGASPGDLPGAAAGDSSGSPGSIQPANESDATHGYTLRHRFRDLVEFFTGG